MIAGEHCVLRTAEPDDAYELKRLYDREQPPSALLDRRRELAIPNVDEVREGLARPDNKHSGGLLALEDRTGIVRGFCGVRNAQPELAYAEVVLMLFDEDDYAAPFAAEAFEHLRRVAFTERRFNKMTTHCLDTETGLRRFLVERGFQSNGVQREVLWSHGRWHDIETFTLFRDGR